MFFATAISNLIVGLYRAQRESSQIIAQRDEWFKLSLSIFGTALVSFMGTLGATGGAALLAGIDPWMALASGFFSACLTTAAAILMLWKRSTLTRGIPILAPMKVEEQVLQGGFALTIPAEPQKK